MKKIAFFILAITILACNNKTDDKKVSEKNTEEKTEKKANNTPTLSYQPEINILVKDTVDDNMMLLGKANKKGLTNKEFRAWYKENYYAHELDTITIEALKPKLENVSIKVFMGTWCSDSQREVPALNKILEEAEYDQTKLEVIAVSHDKDTPDHLEKGMDIQYVPTIIFYKNEKEIGRYVELAQETLEKDMLAILNESGYKHSYEE